jgi:undecaprenyl diphosphate synthase
MQNRFGMQGASSISFDGLHVAMIMDGNGRWANARGQSRMLGHREGARVVRRVVEEAAEAGIGYLTLYAFSSDNWKRPPREVNALMRLFRSYLAAETARCVQNGVRLKVIGRRDRLSPVLLKAISAAESATTGGERLLLRIAIDYSARATMMEAARSIGSEEDVSREKFVEAMSAAINSPVVPDVDLLIRTGGEHRLSDFLLWECAYAELLFEPCMWPEFGPDRLRACIQEFSRRERRFGGLVVKAAG